MKQDGLKATWQDRSMWNQMRMLKTDLSDVTGYTFLVNGKTPQQNWTGAFKMGEKDSFALYQCVSHVFLMCVFPT